MISSLITLVGRADNTDKFRPECNVKVEEFRKGFGKGLILAEKVAQFSI